jgi:hypothetical protein
MSTPRERELTSLAAVLIANGTLKSRSLNVKSPDAPIATQNLWDIVKSKLIADSASKNFPKLLNDMLNRTSYNSAISDFRSLVAPLAAATGKNARIIVCLPDGTVYFDSGRVDGTATKADGTTVPDSNTYDHASDKDINENHNTRACIMNVQLSQDAFAFESKFSTSGSNKIESYVAMRVGPQGANNGTVRYSVY